MGSPPPMLAELLAKAAPAIPDLIKLLTEAASESHDEAMKLTLERYQLAKAQAELARREGEVTRKEAALERERKRLQEEAARIAQRPPTGNAGRFQRATTPAPPFKLPIYDIDEQGRWRLLVPERLSYAWCVAFAAAPRFARALVSQARQSQYRRIARIPFYLGIELDKAGAPLHALRFVAYATTIREQEARGRRILAGERPPRRMPPPEEPETSEPNQRRRERPAHVPARPSKKPRPQEESRPLDAQPHGDDATEQRAARILEVASALAHANLITGRYDPGSASADDVLEDEDVLERARRIVAAFERVGVSSGEP